MSIPPTLFYNAYGTFSLTLLILGYITQLLCSVERSRPYLVKSVFNKCSAVAEIGDRLATIDVGRKVGGTVPLFGG